MSTMLSTVPFQDSRDLIEQPDALQERARRDGYLFFPRLVEPTEVLQVRHDVLQIARTHGFLDQDAPLEDGIAREGFVQIESSTPQWKAFYVDVLRNRAFHALAQAPLLLRALEVLFAEPVLAHSRNICRAIFPNATQYTTPPHQDHIHIGGTTETWSAWIPLGDCPEPLGGLAILPGSHAQGLLPARAAYGAGGLGIDVPDDARWATGELACGDALLFHSLTVHQGRDNTTPDRIRLSADFRYQPRSHRVRADSLQPHQNWITWDEIYAGWPEADPLRYYWKDWDLDVVRREDDLKK